VCVCLCVHAKFLLHNLWTVPNNVSCVVDKAFLVSVPRF